MASIPDLVYDGKTRVGAEVLLYYNLGKGVKIGSLVKTATGIDKLPEAPCADTIVCPTSGWVAGSLPKQNLAAITAVTPGTDGFPLKSPVGSAVEVQDTPSTNINTFSFTGGAVGDTVDILCMPNPADDVLICFDAGFTPTIGRANRPIPRKFLAADHFVRQRPENSVRISDLLVSHWAGLQRINGIDVTLIAKIYPDGGSSASEIQYYLGARLSVPSMNSAAEANDSITIDAEGTFNFAAIFSAPPP